MSLINNVLFGAFFEPEHLFIQPSIQKVYQLMHYSIIIPAYNEEKLLPETLATINKAMAGISRYSGEVVVTDNNSTDRTAEIAGEYGAKVVFESFQQISRSRNVAARAAKGKYLIFTDADTIVSRELIKKSLDLMASGDVCAGGALAKFIKSDLRTKKLSKWWNGFARKMKVACGAYIFCHKEDFIEVGGFNEKVYASEEIWFGRKLKKLARKRHQKFIIVSIPIQTSARKMEWFGPWQLFWQFFPIIFCPWLVRSKRFCDLWYKRPEIKENK
ncbi:MAG: glycosyltransferase involved in cell wall biosynthesis [Pseudohongiellaceae bacterium]|jgi:glycosyltransferase involved in cell wall biosynthesis